jgi:hypothetical protein
VIPTPLSSAVAPLPSGEPRSLGRVRLPYAIRRAALLGLALALSAIAIPAQENYGKLPLSFETNQGQTDSRVKFLSHGGGYTLFLTADEVVLNLQSVQRVQSAGPRSGAGAESLSPGLDRIASHSPLNAEVLRMKLLGANAKPEIAGLDEQVGKSNYFIGNDPAKWHSNVPNFARVNYESIYTGVDLLYYGNQRQLEYDFVVAPGADPRAIRLGITGAKKVAVDAQGDLVLNMGSGEVRLHKPMVYQTTTDDAVVSDSHKQFVSGRFVVKNHNGRRDVAFAVGPYDTTRPLVIDPQLSYSTYLGGNGYDQGTSIAVDSAGDAYVTGSTSSTNFPVTPGAFQSAFSGGDAFVTKVNSTGTALVYSTYLGGNTSSLANGIAVGAAGNAYVVGLTSASDFPTTPGAFQTTYGGGSNNAFVTELNPTGSGLGYSTYLSGSGDARGLAVTVDSAGSAYVTGWVLGDFPVTPGAFQKVPGGGPEPTVFVTKLNPGGSALDYSTYLGGNDYSNSIALDSAGNVYVTGTTSSTSFPVTPGAFQTTFGSGIYDDFVTKLNPTGSTLVYSTFLGSGAIGYGGGVVVDSSGNAYVTGGADSNFPTTPGAFQTSIHGDSNAFVTKLNPSGSALVYSTFLGGPVDSFGAGIALDSAGNAYVTGTTRSTSFPVTPGAFQTTLSGTFENAFVTKLNGNGTALIYSTYLGGGFDDRGYAIALDSGANAYVTGVTASADFPITPGAFQAKFASKDRGSNAFITKMPLIPLPPPPVTVSPEGLTFASRLVGTNSPSMAVTFTNDSTGGGVLDVTTVAFKGADPSDFKIGHNGCSRGMEVEPGGNCVINVIFTPIGNGTRTATLTVTDNAVMSPQTVSLTGTATGDFAITAFPTALTVVRGNSGMSTITITPLQGFKQRVNLTCTGKPTNSSCSVSPSSVALDGTHSQMATLTITTTSHTFTGMFTLAAKGAFHDVVHSADITLTVQ